MRASQACEHVMGTDGKSSKHIIWNSCDQSKERNDWNNPRQVSTKECDQIIFHVRHRASKHINRINSHSI